MSDNSKKNADKALQNIDIPAKLPDEFVPLYVWYKTKGRNVFTGLLICLAVAVCVVSFMRHRENKNSQASAAAFGARGSEELITANSEYGSTASGPIIRLRLAKEFYNEGAFADSERTYKEFLEEEPTHPLVPQAKLGYATVIEAQGESRLDEAYKYYADLMVDKSSSVFTAAVFGAARCRAAQEHKDEAHAIITKNIEDKAAAEKMHGVITRYKKLTLSSESFSLESLMSTPETDTVKDDGDILLASASNIVEEAVGTTDVISDDAANPAPPTTTASPEPQAAK